MLCVVLCCVVLVTLTLLSSLLERIGTYDGHKGTVWGCDITFDSKLLVTGGADTTCIVWDVATGTVLKQISHRGPGNYHILELLHDWNVFYDPILHQRAITCT